jgi:superfamily I DNA and/or RNA helicase
MTEKNSSSEDFSLIENFVNALTIEVAETKKKNIEKEIVLENGERGEAVGSKFIYTFYLDQDLRIGRARDDMPVSLVIGDEEIDAIIVSVGEKKVSISSEKNFGKVIHQAVLKMDNSYLIEKLKKTYEEFLKNKVGKINISTLKRCLLQTKNKIEVERLTDKYKNINEEQYLAVKTAMGSDTVFIWGPPGTGKTFCVSKIIEAFYYAKKRILLVSNTNAAVDIVVLTLGDRLYKTDKDFNEGSVLRHGNIVNETLNRKYADYVNVDKAAERLSKKLVEERKEIEKFIEELRAKAKPFKKIDDAFKAIDVLESEYQSNIDRRNQMKDFLNKSEKMIEDANVSIDKYNRLIKDYEKKGFFGKFFSEDPESQEAKIRSKKGVIDDIKKKTKTYPKEIKKCEAKIITFDKDLNEHKKVTKNKDRKKNEATLKEYQDKIDTKGARLVEISNEIEQVKTQVLKNCRVLAATATKTYLNPEDFNEFDVVVIDEASMLILPQAAYAASLSKEKVVFAGDFMQLPPIYNTDKKHPNYDVVEKWLCHVFDQVNIEKRIKNEEKNIIPLRRQYRMNEKICKLINKYFYDNTLITDESVKKSQKKYPKILNDNLIVVDTASANPFCVYQPYGYSRTNTLHACAVRNLCIYLQENKIIEDITSVGVSTPYKAQQVLLSDLMKEWSLNDVVTGTVHRYQGDQKDIMIFDIPDSEGTNPSKLINSASKFEDGSKLLNVAFSRPKNILIVFANIKYLQERLAPGSVLRGLISDIEDKGKIIDIKDIIKLGPWELPSKKPNLKPKTRVDINEEDSGIFDENNFEKHFEHDLKKAKKYIVIFSAFCTENRTAFWGDILNKKKEEGIKIRIVTRGPKNQGSLKDTAIKGIQSLIRTKINIDLRKDIHQKMVFIDDDILWHGSLNVLSYGGKSEQAETFWRIKSKALSSRAAKNLLYKTQNVDEDKEKKVSIISILAERENRDCQECGELTEVYFRRKGSRAPFLICINCGKTQDMKKRSASGMSYSNKKGKDGKKIDPQVEEEVRYCPKHKEKVKMVIKRNRWGKYFYSCSQWKRDKSGCNYAENV